MVDIKIIFKNSKFFYIRTRRRNLVMSERDRIERWIDSNIISEELKSAIPIDGIADTFTYREAIGWLERSYPGFWKKGKKAKRIVFVKELVPKLIRGEIKVTYRTRPKHGLYYVVESRFRREVRALIEFYRSDVIEMDELTDEDARLAGVETAERLRCLFLKWYGRVPEKVYRNWFRLVRVF